MKPIMLLSIVARLALLPLAGADIATLAGAGESGFSGDGAPATAAKINNPFGVELGADGQIYFCDTGNHVIRKIDRESGLITTVAGTGGVSGYSGDGGPAKQARLFEPYELRFDTVGNLYFVEMKNHLVRRVDAETGMISTVAGTGEAGYAGDGGDAKAAKLNRPHSIVFDRRGNLFICDIGNHRIRRVDAETGEISTFCGTGKKQVRQTAQKFRRRPRSRGRARSRSMQRGTCGWPCARETRS